MCDITRQKFLYDDPTYISTTLNLRRDCVLGNLFKNNEEEKEIDKVLILEYITKYISESLNRIRLHETDFGCLDFEIVIKEIQDIYNKVKSEIEEDTDQTVPIHVRRYIFLTMLEILGINL